MAGDDEAGAFRTYFPRLGEPAFDVRDPYPGQVEVDDPTSGAHIADVLIDLPNLQNIDSRNPAGPGHITLQSGQSLAADHQYQSFWQIICAGQVRTPFRVDWQVHNHWGLPLAATPADSKGHTELISLDINGSILGVGDPSTDSLTDAQTRPPFNPAALGQWTTVP